VVLLTKEEQLAKLRETIVAESNHLRGLADLVSVAWREGFPLVRISDNGSS